ncbi:dTDP-4-dehydrorhamnose reductase [Streptomyces sp. NPDC127033]|uniref:dTDP-4-dehydrorhamnose reductase n=1 Tax=Streptomyces sp. NPDC127033 TaxID=3347110 RepID=UPI0036522235
MKPLWLIAGAGGMLGRHLTGQLAGQRVVPLDRHALDITDQEAVDRAIAYHRPRIVVNAAAWTAADAAEAHRDRAWEVNVAGVRHLARACRRQGALLLHVSSDYVFPGTARTPYPEDAPTGPCNTYGRTKAAAEREVLELLPGTGYVVRTAWVYGVAGRNFVNTMIGLERTQETVDVVDDQCGQPTWAQDLAGILIRLGDGAHSGSAPPGIYHGTNRGETTWHGLSREVFRLLGADPSRVLPVTSAELALPAVRPAYSALGHDRWAAAGITPLRHWRSALHTAFPALLGAHAQGRERESAER